MPYTLFLDVDPGKVQGAEYSICFTNEVDNFGLGFLFAVENENDDRTMVGLEHLCKAIVSTHVYKMLDGFKWQNILEIEYSNDRCGALVEFASKADAMVFKLSCSVQ